MQARADWGAQGKHELDAEAALDGAACGAQRPADAAGELMAALDAEADEDPEEGA